MHQIRIGSVWPRVVPPLLTWAVAWAGLFAFDDWIGVPNQALILVLAAAIAALWWRPAVSAASSALATSAFNFAFVPPRGTFSVDLPQHALLLLTTLAVSWIVAFLMARLRAQAAEARQQAQRADQLREFGDLLRATTEVTDQAAAAQNLIAALTGAPAALLLDFAAGDPSDAAASITGSVTPDESAGLWLCRRDGRPIGPGTGRYDEQAAWYLPLRGRGRIVGAALVRLPPGAEASPAQRVHVQALCDQLGAALEHAAAIRGAAAARQQAQSHAHRNTLLAAISHDHRTPLATILGAASALHDQGERLSLAQRRKLAGAIVDEATQLSRLTDNTLQLARMGGVELALQRDWESVEELVGTVVRRVRQRHPGCRVNVRTEPGLPLLRCDAVLLVQLLDNLIDNALKYGGTDAPVEVVTRELGHQVVVAVRDRGPGVPPAQRERVFETFQRVEAAGRSAQEPSHRGAGIGLALCRAIARAHGGDVRLRPRSRGGASFELVLPIETAPAFPAQSTAERVDS